MNPFAAPIQSASIRFALARFGFAVALIAVGIAVAADRMPTPPTAHAPNPRNQPQAPFRIYANTWYVGTHGISSILITSSHGHILIDGAFEESAPLIAANIRKLGFRIEDVRMILNSHAHCDHAGGIAQLQQWSGAQVAASVLGAQALERGDGGSEDPLTAEGQGTLFPKVAHVRALEDGQTVQVGDITVVAHLTPGHTAGGTSWTWRSCADARCLEIAYADSLNPLDYNLIDNRDLPHLAEDFTRSFEVMANLPCDIVLAPHPDVVQLWDRLEKSHHGKVADAFVEPDGCRNYANGFRKTFDELLAKQRAGR